MEYQKISPSKNIVYDASNDTISFQGSIFSLARMTGNQLRSLLPLSDQLIIILDEIDRLIDPSVLDKLSELAKNISTYQTNIKIIFVGVASTADELLKGHASNFRNIKQVSLDRMTTNELSDIINHGEKVLGITFETIVRYKIIELCDHLPYYLHLLATSSAKSAIVSGESVISSTHLDEGIKLAATDADQTLRVSYQDAILSVKRSEIYKQSLYSLAALVDSAQTVASIAQKLNEIASKSGKSNVTPQAVGHAVKKLATSERGNILTLKQNRFYSFTNPLMKGFVRLMQEQE